MAEKNMNAKISVEFEETANRQQLSSGDNLPTLFGKIKKIISDLSTSAFSGSYNDLSDKPTTATTDTDGLMSSSDKNKLDSADDTYALKSLYGDSTINVGRKAETDVGEYSTAEGYDTTASGGYSHAEGEYSTASGYASHAEGSNSNLKGILPDRTVIISDVDYTITGSTAYGMNSHAEGTQSFAYGYSSHAEGYNTTASGSDSHAEGYNATASGHNSHAEGVTTTASGSNSHAEGTSTTASGTGSHAEGNNTTASGKCSHAGGCYTTASKEAEFAHGKFNESNDDTLFSVGDGTSDSARHNAFEITTTGGKLHDKDIATTDLIPNPNLLINPDFKINQRRLSSYNADWNHTVDRWVQFGAVVSPNSSGDINISKRDEADYFGFIQRTEILQSDCNGKSMTLSAKINGEVLSGTIIRSNVEQIFFNIGNSSDRFIISSYSNNDIKYIIVQLYGSKSYNIEWVKLEYGSVATPFIPPDPASELLKCQRYYQIRSMNDISTVDLCPNMRDGVVPTITALADGNYSYEAEL